MLEKHCNYI